MNLIVLGAVQKGLFVTVMRKKSFAGATAGDMAGMAGNDLDKGLKKIPKNMGKNVGKTPEL